MRLTIAFSLVQLGVFGGSALGVYLFVTNSFDFDAAESDGAVNVAEQGFAALRVGLIGSFLLLALLVPVVSYALARRVLRPVRESYAAQQRFVDDASHEFRTPLGVLQGEIEVALSRDRDTDEYRLTLVRLLREVERLEGLTGSLLMLARGSAPHLRDTFELVDVTDAVRDAIDSVTSDRSVDVRSASPATVHGSHDLLVTAIGNLVDNALKFSPDDTAIVVEVRERGSSVVVEVADAGPGLSAAAASHAFERFWRADESRATSGHGLGLALVDQIARVHGGRASIHNGAGFGTVATIELPIAR